MNKRVQVGDTVKVHYVSKLETGAIFDTNIYGEPLQFKVGSGAVIRGFENGLIGMRAGEYKRITIPDDMAYGPRFDDLILVLARNRFPQGIEPEVGKSIEIGESEGPITTVFITEVTDTSVTVDGNHPLAGRTLVFDIKLVEIV